MQTRKKKVLLPVIIMLLGTGMANAQKAYVSVQQNDTKIAALGTAAFDLSSSPSVEFVDGKAVMTVGDNTVAKLPMSDGGQLAVEFTTTMADADLNKVTKTYTNPYATLYSPFQLTVPSGVEVYAPTYDAVNHVLKCNSETLIAEENVIPVEIALLLKNAGTYVFAISDGASTDLHTSALSGSSLLIDVPTMESGYTLYTLGHEASDNTKFGFFKYNGTTLGAGLAYLVAETIPSEAKYVALNFDDVDGINLTPAISQDGGVRKYLENGNVVILKNGKKYNLNGQEVK